MGEMDGNEITQLPEYFTPKERSLRRCAWLNNSLFEEKWDLIRGQINARWSLMVEYDLLKVDKAEMKFDKFVTMLQVKYGYTRQKASEEINELWSEYKSNNRNRN